jgi:methyl-accepting chemotaxis protein
VSDPEPTSASEATEGPEREDEASAADGGGPLAALGAAALRPLVGVAGIAEDIREMTGYVRRMVRNTETLPDVTETLHAIRERTENLDREVAEMHVAVEEMRAMLEPLAGQLESVSCITDRLPGGRRRRRAQAEADEASRAHDAG